VAKDVNASARSQDEYGEGIDETNPFSPEIQRLERLHLRETEKEERKRYYPISKTNLDAFDEGIEDEIRKNSNESDGHKKKASITNQGQHKRKALINVDEGLDDDDDEKQIRMHLRRVVRMRFV
jgi:hypothetical protein